MQFPFEHRAEVIGGQVAGDATGRVLTASVVALVLIYLLLQSALRSWWLALAALGDRSGRAVPAVPSSRRCSGAASCRWGR